MKIPFTDIEIVRKKVTLPQQQADTLDAKKTPDNKTADNERPSLPVSGGRQSVPEGNSFLTALFQDMATIEPDFEIKLLEVLEGLAKYNADVSFAIDNIVQLGNTNHELFFDDDISEEQQKVMKVHIEKVKDQWYSHSGGINSMINDLLRQTAVTGALSAEIVPLENLERVKKVVIVSPKNIRFLYDTDRDDFIPHQVVPYSNGQFVSNGGLKELNTVTYKYIALARLNEKPYAIPPFLSALENLGIERTMLDNLKHITKQLGVFGFLQVLMKAPTRRMTKSSNGEMPETDEQYSDRCKTYLRQQVPEIEKSLAKGYLLGFEGTHTFDMKGNLANPEGARALFDLNTEMKMAGLKQDPLMLGRNFSTTETIGRVILTKLSSQIVNYQKIVGSFLQSLYLIELNLAGYVVNRLEVEFDKPTISDEMNDQSAYGKKIENYNNLYQQGVISQQERAQALGWDEPDEEEPRGSSEFTDPAADNTGSAKTDPKNNGTKKDQKANEISPEDIIAMSVMLGGDIAEFDYGVEHDHDCDGSCEHHHSFASPDPDFDWGSDKVNAFFKKYLDETGENYGKAIKKASKQVADKLAELTTGATVGQVTDAIIYTLYKEWKANFTTPQKKIIEKWVSLAYREFRKDKKVFGKDHILKDGKKVTIPNAAFNLKDMRTIEYFKTSDDLYMSKFITDGDTRSRLTKFIKEKYITGELPLGDNKKALALFKEQFGNLMEGEEWKLWRIIATTTNKMRNYAAVNYMAQAEVEEFEIVGIRDYLQCAYCAEMQGKRFSVTRWSDKVEEFTKSDPAYVKGVSPFINSVYKGKDGVEALKNATVDELEKNGIGLPPYHPRCRDQVIAVL